MVVTGSEWQKLTLGKLIPALDPEREGSAASRINCEITRIQEEVDKNLGKVTDLTSAVSNTLSTVEQLGTEIGELQNQIEDLITNALNTGVFMHTLGLNPLFGSTSPGSISQEIARTFADTEDPNRPVFKGDGLAAIGGVLVLVSAPNINEMIAAIRRLGTIFPVFRAAIEGVGEELEETADVFTDDFLDPITDKFSDLGSIVGSIKSADLYSPQPFENLYDQAAYESSVASFEFEGWDGVTSRSFNKWYALRLTDLIPALDPTVEDSPAKLIADAERAAVNGTASLLQQAGGLSESIRQVTEAVNFLNRRLQRLGTDLQNTVRAISETGLFVHTIGLDGTVTNSQQFIDACNRALHDVTDSDRPRGSGGMTAFAGFEIVFGAANPAGLKTQFSTIGNVFGGLETDIQSFGGIF